MILLYKVAVSSTAAALACVHVRDSVTRWCQCVIWRLGLCVQWLSLWGSQ